MLITKAQGLIAIQLLEISLLRRSFSGSTAERARETVRELHAFQLGDSDSFNLLRRQINLIAQVRNYLPFGPDPGPNQRAHCFLTQLEHGVQ